MPRAGGFPRLFWAERISLAPEPEPLALAVHP
jgi:hypothetical protein